MYCMCSRNFDVVQTALRNLPEYVLLCRGKRMVTFLKTCHLSMHIKNKNTHQSQRYAAIAACRKPLSSSRRTCRHLATRGVYCGYLRTNWHQFGDRGVHEGPSHGSNITTSHVTPHLIFIFFVLGLDFLTACSSNIAQINKLWLFRASDYRILSWAGFRQ